MAAMVSMAVLTGQGAAAAQPQPDNGLEGLVENVPPQLVSACVALFENLDDELEDQFEEQLPAEFADAYEAFEDLCEGPEG